MFLCHLLLTYATVLQAMGLSSGLEGRSIAVNSDNVNLGCLWKKQKNIANCF